MKKPSVVIDIPVCPYGLQECKRGEAPCPVDLVNNMDDWLTAAESTANCGLRGPTLTKGDVWVKDGQ